MELSKKAKTLARSVRFFYVKPSGKLRPHALTSSLVVATLIGSMLISLFVADKTGRAQNYDKLWTTTDDFNAGTNSNIDTADDEAKLATTTTDFNEGFTGSVNKDAATDANWDTSAHKLTLPGDPANGISTDLQAKWKSATGANEDITASIADTANGVIYFGGGAGSFGAYKIATSTAYNLTSKISADWSTNVVIAFAIDATNHFLYMGGATAKFGAFSLSDDPSTGTWTYLNSKITSDWSTNGVTSMSFDSTNGFIYIGGNATRFGAYTINATPSSGTFTYLNSKIATDWGNNTLRSMTFDPTNNIIYFGGTNAKFGAYLGGADPTNGTWTYLWAKLNTAGWSIYGIYGMTFDTTNRIVYFGGETGQIAAFNGGADPANGTVAQLSGKTGSWGLNVFNAFTFDSANSIVYMVGGGGRLGAFTCNATPANDTFTYLTAKISTDWGANAGNTVSFNSASGLIYLGGVAGRFGSYNGTAIPANGTWANITPNVAGSLRGYNIMASTYDSTNGIVYMGGDNGYLAAYTISTGNSVNLTSKISTNWSTNLVQSLSFDSANGKIYLGGPNGKFGAYSGGNDPANGTWSYLTAKISADWTTNTVYALTFDSTNNKIYLGGTNGKFGAYSGGDDPANGTWSYLTAKISADWTTNTVYALTFDSTNNKIYLGGNNGKFGAYAGGSDPANGTWVNLTAKISSDWSTNFFQSLAFDSTNGKIYLGGSSGKFGAYAGGSDPANGTWTYLSSKISSDWGSAGCLGMIFASGKIFIAGDSGKFGVFTGGATPSTGSWAYLFSTISSFNRFNTINTLTWNAATSTIYIGSQTGTFTSLLIGYVSNKNALSTKLNVTTQNIFKATLTATETKPANTEIIYYLSNDGGANWHVVTSGAEYTFATSTSDLRWKANLTTTNLAITPEITGIAISYKYFTSNTGSLNLTFDAAQAVTSTLLSWSSTQPVNTALAYKIRSAATSEALSAATWSDTKTNADTPVNLKAINVGGAAGVSENQWYEAQIDFTTNDGLTTPVLSDITMQYVINQAPQIQNIIAAQRVDGSKIVDILYELKDPDTSLNSYNQDQVAISLQYSIDDGDNWVNCATTAGTGLKNVNDDGSWTSLSSTWDAGTDLANQYYNNSFKVKVLANDNEQAHNTAELASSAISLDTANPILGSIAGGFMGLKIANGANWTNDTTPDLALASSDDTAVQMEIRNDNSFLGIKEAYTTSKVGWALTANDGTKNIFVRFYDAFGNYSDATTAVLLDTTAPAGPTYFTLFDTSNIDLGTYTITIIWNPVNNPGDFEKYSLERSTNGTDWSELATFSNLAADVYADKSLSNETTYYYRMRTKDIHENYSSYTEVKDLQPAGSDTVAPEITGPGPTSQAFSTTANVTWITSEPADSYVEFGTTEAYGNNQGSDELVTNHSVTVIGLQPTTTYHYRVKSRDGNSNKVTSADYTFTTTLSDEASESLTITGATAQKPGADPEEVTIIWTTDKYASSQVLYGKTEALGQETTEDATLNKTHYVTLTKLEPNTKYYYKVRSRDTYGNSIDGEQRYFVTAQSDATGTPATPSINFVEISDITMTSAIISWQTTTVATSIVEIGSGDGYSGHIEDISSGSTTQHVIRLKDLVQGTEYHFRVMGQNSSAGWVASDNYKFDTVPEPSISSISIRNIASTSATVSWKTNVPTDSTVDYGETDTSLSQGSSANVTEHEVNLVSLKPATKYLFAIRIRDSYGNNVASQTMDFQTIVDTTGPVIRDMKSETSIITDSSGASKAQAIVSWSTDEPSTAQVKYAMGVAAGSEYPLSTTEDTNLSTSHVVIISNLSPSATYHMKIVAKDASNNVSVSDDYTVLTLNQDKSLLQYIVQILEERFSWLKSMGLF